MKLLLTIALGLANAVSGDCDACIDGHCYRKHLLSGVGEHTGDIDWNTNTLYVIDVRKSEITSCNLDTMTCNKNTANIWDFTRITVNQKTGDLYGSHSLRPGIFKLDLMYNAKDLFVPKVLAMDTTFHDKLYYSGNNDGKRGIFTFEDGVSRMVPGTNGQDVPGLVIEKNSDIYAYTQSNPTRTLRVLIKEIVNHTKLWYSDFHATVDRNGNVYFFDVSSHAVYREMNGVLVEVGAVNTDRIYHTKFDRDNNFVCVSFPEYRYFHYKKESDVECTIAVVRNKRIITETIVGTRTMY